MSDNVEIHPKMYMYRRIVEAKNYIDVHFSEKIDLDEISDKAAFSKYYFIRLFKKAFGLSPHKYLTQVRLEHAKKLLKEGKSITDVCDAVGFESIPSFTGLFKAQMGISPGAFSDQLKATEEDQKKRPMAYIPGCFAQGYSFED